MVSGGLSTGGLPPAALHKILGPERTVLHDRLVSIKSRKGDQEDAVFLRTDHQILLASAKGKLLVEFHLLDVKKIESKSTEEMTLHLDKKEPLTLRTPHCDELISHIRVGCARDFPSARDDMRIQLALVPPTRVDEIKTFFPEFDFKAVPMGPCGGFSRTYKSLCLYHGLPIRDDVVWDIDNISFVKSVKDFNFTEIDDIENNKDIIPLLGALEGNTWFTALQIRDIKLLPEGQTALINLLRTNTTIERLDVCNTGASDKFFLGLGESLAKNTNTALLHLNLSESVIKDEGFTSLAMAIQGLRAGLLTLNLSNCQLGKKAATALGGALRKNMTYLNSLSVLDLSNNNIGPEGVTALADFLAQPNNIKRLCLANTGANVEALFGALFRGCTQSLVHLDLSNNKFAKKPTVTQASFEQFFSSVVALKHVDFSSSKIQTAYLEALMSRLVNNAFVTELVLRLSDNDFTAQSATIINRYLSKSHNIVELDVSDNDLMGDEGILQILKGLKNSTVQRVRLERMFKTRSKFRELAILELASLLNSERVKLTSLSLANCALKGDIIEVIDSIGSNDNLTQLDVSGNLMGDKGAFALSKAIQKNQTLRKLVWDNNGTTIVGYSAFVIAMSRNRTLQQMPLPMNDLSASLKVADARTRAFMSKMEELLALNQRPERLDGSAAVDNSQGQLLTAAQQDALDRLTVQVKRVQNNLSDDARKSAEAQQIMDELAILFADVETNRQLPGMLSSSMEGLQAVQDGKLAENLQGFCHQLEQVLEEQFQKAVSETVDMAKCTFKWTDSKMTTQLNMFMQVGAQKLDKLYLQKVLVQQVAAELAFSRATSMASVVSIANNFVFERLSERLEDVLERLQNLSKVEPAATPVSVPSTPLTSISAARTASVASANAISTSQPMPVSDEADDDVSPDVDMGAPPALIAALSNPEKKKFRQSRRIDAAELQLPTTLPPPQKDSVRQRPPSSSEVNPGLDLSSTSDLGSAAPVTLTHMTKGRPMQANKRLPTRQARPSRGASTRAEREGQEDAMIALEPVAATPAVPAPKPVPQAAPPPTQVTTPADAPAAVPRNQSVAAAAPITNSAPVTPAKPVPTVPTAAAPAPSPVPVIEIESNTNDSTPDAKDKGDRKKSAFFSKVFGGGSGKKEDKPVAKVPVAPIAKGNPLSSTSSVTATTSATLTVSPSSSVPEKLSDTVTSVSTSTSANNLSSTSTTKSTSMEKIEEPVVAPIGSIENDPTALEAAEPVLVVPTEVVAAEPPKVAPKVFDKPKPKLPPGAVPLGMPMGAAMAQQQQAMAAIAQRRAAAAAASSGKDSEESTSEAQPTTAGDEPKVPMKPTMPKPPPVAQKAPLTTPKPSRPLPSQPDADGSGIDAAPVVIVVPKAVTPTPAADDAQQPASSEHEQVPPPAATAVSDSAPVPPPKRRPLPGLPPPSDASALAPPSTAGDEVRRLSTSSADQAEASPSTPSSTSSAPAVPARPRRDG